MNLILKKILFFAILFLLALHAAAQQAEIPPPAYLNFSSITIKDGLSQGMINYMLQDHFGFMWFATNDGLNRYDGYNFVVYRNDITDAASLADNHVRVLFEDNKGRLWVGTENNGLDLFDRNTEKFIHFRHSATNQNTIVGDHINRIAEDRSGAIWVSTTAGINRIKVISRDNKRSDTIITKIELPKKTNTGDAFAVADKNTDEGPVLLFRDSKGLLWIFSKNIAYKVNTIGDSFTMQPFSLQQSIPKTAPGLDYDIVSCAEDTVRGFLYFISNRTVFRIDQKNNNIDFFDFTKYNRGVIGAQITADENGLLWFTDLGRINIIDFATHTIKQIYYAHNSKVADGVFNVYRDHNGIIWVGTAGYGILKHLPRTSKFHFISYSSVMLMNESIADKLNIRGSETKHQLFDLNQGKFVYYETPAMKLLQRFQPVSELKFIYFNGRHSAVANGFLYWCNEQSGKFIPFKQLNEQRQVLNDNNGLWFGAVDSLLYLNEQYQQLESFAYPVQPVNTPYSFCMAMMKDDNSNIWLATMKGVLCFNTKTNEWKRFNHRENDTASLSSDISFCICADPKQPGKYVWVGTYGSGLNRLDVQTGKAKCYREKDGLPNGVIYGIVADSKGNLWMSTNKGLSCFNPVTNIFLNYNEADGLQGNEFNRYAYGRSSSGWLYFGGINGFNYFKPQDISADTIFSKVIFTDFKISNKSVAFDKDNTILSKPVYLTGKIVLPYKYNMISFDFASANLSQPAKNFYQYKLDGFDENWISSGTAHTATYTNLDPGTYTFDVRASNNPNAWGSEAATIELTIVPPWYMTWWFRTALGLAIAGGLYALYRYRINQAFKLQAIRNRIAADLHDEIGSALSSISIFSEVIEDQTKEQLPEVTPVIKRISESTINMMDAMSDIVWTINPKNDRFENIITRMQAFASEMLEAVNCKLVMNIDARTENLKLSMTIRKNFYLIFKEAINNIAKYAAANNVQVNVWTKNATVYLNIQDDGKGFEIKENATGNGLLNMKKRAGELKGHFQVKSTPGKGTVIEIWFPV